MSPVPAQAAHTSEDPAQLTARLLLRISYFVLAIGVPVTAAFSRQPLFVMLPFGAVLMLISAAVAQPPGVARRVRDALLSPIGAAALLLFVWAALSLIWTPFPGDGGQRLFKLAGTILLIGAAIVGLPERTRIATLYLMPIGVGIAAVMTMGLAANGAARMSGGIEGHSFTLARSVLAIVVLVWPGLAALATRNRWTSVGALAVAVTVAALATHATLAFVALAIGGLAYGLARVDIRRTALALAVLGALPLVFGPLVPFAIKAGFTFVAGGLPQALQPVAVWADVVHDHRARLITGHGLETMLRGMALGYLPENVPRTVLFEIWYEFGVVGALALAFIVAMSFLRAVHVPATVAPFFIAGIATIVALALLDHHIAQFWWMSLLCVAAVCHLAVLRGQYRTKRPAVRPTL